MKKALIIFIKNPEKGKVKTRLAEGVGGDRALKIYKALLEKTRSVAQQVEADRFLFYSDRISRRDDFDNTSFRKYVQCGGDLGQRMSYAFSLPFKSSYRKAVIIGSDCWDLEPRHIEEAFDALDQHDYVIGPAEDGGYYLLGMKQWQRSLFEDKSWSSSELMKQTSQQIEESGATYQVLETLSDIDREEDIVGIEELNSI
jgi:rSAM/selenodomain-associated transferase 1